MEKADCYVCSECFLGVAVIQLPTKNISTCVLRCCGKPMDFMMREHENLDGSPNALVAAIRDKVKADAAN